MLLIEQHTYHVQICPRSGNGLAHGVCEKCKSLKATYTECDKTPPTFPPATLYFCTYTLIDGLGEVPPAKSRMAGMLSGN